MTPSLGEVLSPAVVAAPVVITLVSAPVVSPVVDTHYVTLPAYLYHEVIRAGGGVHDEAVTFVRIDGLGIHDLPGTIFDTYHCGTWERIEGCAIIIYEEDVCGSRKGISAVAGLGHVLKHPLRILAE